jgi:hypothetical protein
MENSNSQKPDTNTKDTLLPLGSPGGLEPQPSPYKSLKLLLGLTISLLLCRYATNIRYSLSFITLENLLGIIPRTRLRGLPN